MTKTHPIQTSIAGRVELTFNEAGDGRPLLLLHGGGGTRSVAEFTDQLAEAGNRVIVPTHPGFEGTSRPDGLRSIRQLAELYRSLLEELDLRDVIVVGNSIGGWIAAEMAIASPSERVEAIVLVDAVGIEVPGHPVVDFFSISMDEVFRRSYDDPAKFAIDPASMSPEQRQAMAGNREALAVYAGEPSMVDPGLRERLRAVSIPCLVVWGESDRIADPDYGRAYAEAIPGGEFELLAATGHMPQIESPEQRLRAITNFAASHEFV